MSWKIYEHVFEVAFTAQKMKVSVKYFFSNWSHLNGFGHIYWSHLLKKSLKENFNLLRRLSNFLDILEVYLEPCQTSKMKFFAKIVITAFSHELFL